MSNLRQLRRNAGSNKKKGGFVPRNSVVSKGNDQEPDNMYNIPSEVWNNWNYETKFRVRKMIGDESVTNADCVAMIQQLVSDSLANGNKKMEETNILFAALAERAKR